jgi:hypothetical protein
MRVGIIELKDSHSTLIHSLVHIYDFDENEIVIFTTSLIQEYLGDLGKNSKVRFVIKEDGENLKSFFTRINSFQLDKAFITTFSATLSALFRSRAGFPVSLFIHNIDEWQRKSPIQQIKGFMEGVRLHGIKQAGYQLKKHFIEPIRRRKISDMVVDSGGRFIVLNSLLKEQLADIIPGDKIEIIPFWVYDKRLSAQAVQEDPTRLSICIPGKLSTIRRDYLNFFHFISEHLELFKRNFKLILLGNISPFKEERSEDIIKAAESLKAKGFRIQFYNGFIPFQEYGRILSGSDILLGNVIFDLGPGKSYGLTKDSGVIYNMVHAAKPGFVPEGFRVADEFQDYIIVYEDYDQLLEKLLKIKNDKTLLARLQKKASRASEGFEPYQIYKRIEKYNVQ